MMIERLVVNRPIFTILIISFIISLFLISALNLKFGSADYSDSFPPWDEIYLRYELYYKDFGLAPENVYIFVKADDVLTRDVFEYMLTLQNAINQIDGVISTTSPASFVEEIYGGIPDNDYLLEMIAEKSSGLLPDKSLALISVQIGRMESDKLMNVAENIEKSISYVQQPPGVTVEVTGGAVLMYQITEAVIEDVYRTFFVASVVMVFVLVVVFSGVVRRKLTVLFPLVISMLSVSVMVGSMPLLGLTMTEYVSATVPILIGLAIDYAAQLQNRFEDERRESKDVENSILTAIRTTRFPLFMAMATTVIGFTSMAAPSIPSLVWFGTLMSLGLVSAFLLSLTILPAMLKITDSGDEGVKHSPRILEKFLTSIAKLTTANPKKILALAAVLIILGAYATTQVQLETNRRKYAPPDLPALVKFEELERSVSPQYVYAVVLSADRIDADTMIKAEELANYISQREKIVYSYETLGKTLRSFYGRIPSSEKELSLALSKIPESVYERFISGNHLVILLYTNTQTEEEVHHAIKNFEGDIRFFGWDGEYYITGFPVILAHLSEVLFSSLNLMTAVAYALIVIFLLLAYRSLLRAVIPLISISVAVAAMNICMVVMCIKQTTISVALNSIVLGMGIDYSIHITERYFEEREKFGVVESVRKTIEKTGKAVLTSALTTAGGFGALYFSSFPVLSNFGILAFIAVIFSLLAAVSVVPAFLILYETTSVRPGRLSDLLF
ncbi:MAG: RND family transporter [Archaeoglobus sp.]|uniref:efflux RND transporter permease subunit n=1 Tax=Archaeoglobus sp. TaxID=1872626 RepID=UPI001D724FC0|nr:RND family transporter [Archaeoglobus sp.]MBO8180232.1 RND family transporter [Archaeoglobus sp.]